MVHVIEMGLKKISMWCLFAHCWIPFKMTLTSLCLEFVQIKIHPDIFQISSLVLCICPSLDAQGSAALDAWGVPRERTSARSLLLCRTVMPQVGTRQKVELMWLRWASPEPAACLTPKLSSQIPAQWNSAAELKLHWVLHWVWGC